MFHRSSLCKVDSGTAPLSPSEQTNQREGSIIVFRPPPTPSLPDSHHSFHGARTHSNAISPARSGPHSVPPSPLPHFSSAPPSSPSFVRSVRYSKLQAAPPPPNLNGELGIAQRYGLGDSGRSAQIPLSPATPLPLGAQPTHPTTSQFPSGLEKLVQFHGKNLHRTRPRPTAP